MRRPAKFTLALAIGLVLAACGSPESPPEAGRTSAPTTSPTPTRATTPAADLTATDGRKQIIAVEGSRAVLRLSTV